MAPFKKPTRFGGSPRPTGNRGNIDQKELHTATCNKCQAKCQVPFRPNGKKPVYCANCFTRPEQESGDKREYPQRRTTSTAPSNADLQIAELSRQVAAMARTLDHLVTTIDTFNRATALTDEIRKHFPAPEKDSPKKAVKKAAPKKTTEKA